MVKDYIVVAAADAQIAGVALGMLFAQRNNLSYPMPGPTLFIWIPRISADGTEVAFGPIDSLDGEPTDFGTWCLGRELTTGIGTLTFPEASESLDTEWFPPPME